jgi:hypothetical protein
MMARRIGWIGLLRIERFVWALDQQLYDLPSDSRIAKRREVRDNLLAAAREVGTTEALRRLGGSRRLALEYLSAELGDRPRPSWFTAVGFGGLFPLIVLAVLDEAADAFRRGILAADPHATGSYSWAGVGWLQREATFTFTDGQATQVGGYPTIFAGAIWVLGIVLAGRLWRMLPSKSSAN